MIDGSASLNQWGENNYQKIINATRSIISLFNDNNNQPKFGIVVYATTADVRADFSFTRSQVDAVLANMSYPSGWTRIGTGLNTTREDLFTGGRQNTHSILVVFTDGTSVDGVSVASQLLHDTNVTIIVIGLGEWYDINQVQRMASDPHAETVLLTTPNKLQGVEWRIHEMICKGKKRYLYFQVGRRLLLLLLFFFFLDPRSWRQILFCSLTAITLWRTTTPPPQPLPK